MPLRNTFARLRPAPHVRRLAPVLAVTAACVAPGAAVRAQGAPADTVPQPPAVGATAVYDGSEVANLAGGIRRGATYLGALSVQLRFDGRQLVGWPGATAFVYALQTHGGNPSDRVGDVQGVSNLAAPTRLWLEEAWLQQNFGRDRLSVLAGLYDLNSEFYRLQSSALFVNSSFGIGPAVAQSGQLGPSIYPRTSLGARVAFKPARTVVLRAAVLDGVPVVRGNGTWRAFAPGDGALLVGEAVVTARPEIEGLPRNARFRIGRFARLGPYEAKVAVGTWYYTARFADVADTLAGGAPVSHRGSGGAYAVVDQTVWADRAHAGRALTLFGQAGVGDGRVNEIGSYTGGGLALSAPLPGRSGDEAGLGVAAAYRGSHYRRQQRAAGQPAAGAEVTVEATYLAQLAPWLAVQPDAQYVVSPGLSRATRNAFTAALRFELSR